jgi:CubicO group peptidase (beta-lactamase class C family)
MTQHEVREPQGVQRPLRIPGDRLQRLLGDLVGRKGFRHSILAVETVDGSVSWSGAAGIADPDDTPMSPAIPYFIASIDNLYTATAILRLYERGRLRLGIPGT